MADLPKADIDSLNDLVACPRCDKYPLQQASGGWRCKACQTDYPLVSTMPWLFAEPRSSLAEWRARAHFALKSLAHDSQKIETALNSDELSALTRARLYRQLAALAEHRNQLRSVLEPLDVAAVEANYESHLALRTRLPPDQGIHTYFSNVHRDWSWGDEENRLSLSAIVDVADRGTGLPDAGNILVLGAGAGRLAFDIHHSQPRVRTVALDFNPLLFLIAERLLQGDSLDMYEFPLAPVSTEDYAIRRRLEMPHRCREGFHLVLGDALRAPFRAGVFDVVVTPWLVDVLPEDFPVFARRVNRLLSPSGQWISFGSLKFEHALPARQYSLEETLEFVSGAGFAAPTVEETTLPYMCSPSSRHGRSERVVTFLAQKLDEVEAPARHKALPDWLVTGKQPVPALPSFRTQALTNQVYTFIMSLVDGKRTIADMAQILEKQQLMTASEAESSLRNFFTRMYDDSERQARF